jgi:hypothetical protein
VRRRYCIGRTHTHRVVHACKVLELLQTCSMEGVVPVGLSAMRHRLFVSYHLCTPTRFQMIDNGLVGRMHARGITRAV